MPRVKDIAWKFVTRLEGEKWCCPYCETEYSGKVTRVKSHFLKHPNKGISPCKKVPEHISMLMELLQNQVDNKDDIAWKFVDRLEDNKWRCHYCSVEFSGDLTGVKDHLLKAPIEGISICTEVPDHIRTLMRSLLDEVAEEENREVAEGQSREAHGQSSIEPNSRDLPSQAEVAEEEIREANCQFSTEPQSCDVLSPAVPRSSQSSEDMENLLTTTEWATDMENFTSDVERHFHETSVMLSLAQNIHDENIPFSMMALAEVESHLLDPPCQPQYSNRSPYPEEMQMNDQQTPARALSFQYVPSPAVGNSNCLQDCNRHSQLQTPMDVDPSIVSQHRIDSHITEATIVDLQVPEVTTNTISPSSSQDMNNGSPIMNVWRTPQTRRWMEQMMKEDRAVDIANLPLDGATSYSVASSPPNSFFPNSPNELLPFLTESLTSNPQQNPSAPLPSQNHQFLDNTFQNESRGSILPSLIASDAQLTKMATTNNPHHFNQPDQTFHRQYGRGTGLSPPRASMDIEPPIRSQPFKGPSIIEPCNSPPQIPEDIINTIDPSTSEGAPSFHYDQLLGVGNSNLGCNQPRISSVTSVTNIVPHSNQPLPICNDECGTETSSFSLRDSRGICPVTARQPTRCPHIEATHVNLQVLEDGTNMAGPSPSQVQPALVPPQHQSVPHQFISPQTRNAQQNPTGLSSSQKNPIVPCHPQAPINMDPCILSSAKAHNNASPPPQIPRCVTGLIGPSSLPELDINKGVPLTRHTNIDNDFKKSRALKRKMKQLYRREANVRDKLEFAASLSLKKPRMEVKKWLADVEKLRNDFHSIKVTSENCLPPHQQVDILMQEAEDLIQQGRLPKGLFVARESKVTKLLERKLVGEAFQRNTRNILEYLVGNQISRVGIYGMGGVGKTTLMVHVYNKLLEKANYDNVLWITVSQDFNTQKLQDDIWEALGLGILGEKDVRKRATRLSDGLTKREKLIIILDDVWECFDLKEVGIPVRADGLKLVLTTRSFDVCRQMRCQEKIKIEPISQEEAESLFFEELGSEVALNLEIEAIVKSIVKECAGLPLGVVIVAASMREVTDVFEWKDCLLKLKESDMGQMDMVKKVLMILKFSYDRLGNREVQQCFLSCALYPEDQLIDKIKLIEFFIDQGLIGGLNTREKQYDRGLTILNKLENVCLLENYKEIINLWGDYEERIKMHNLIRDMALHILSVTSIVKAGKQLRNIPSEEYWTDALEKVSLMKNCFIEFPMNMSPNCPKLSTLLLNGCLLRNAAIPDSFFKNLLGLKVLNMSENDMTELPNSISDLVNLRALLLQKCWNLSRIPYLGKLTSLRKLDARDCGSLEALEGLDKLVNLRYLDLTQTRIERLPKRTLDRLLNLQWLNVGAINKEDITKLGALETFRCYLENADDFNKCVGVIEQSNNPRYYNLNVAKKESKFIVEVSNDTRFRNLGRSVNIREWGHAIVSVGGECTGIFILIPRNVQMMTMGKCNDITNLSSMGPLKYPEELEIEEWENLGALCGGQDEEVIDIHHSPAPTLSPLLFLSLRVLKIDKCSKLKYLFGHGSKSNLPHLREIVIYGCEEMVGIIAAVTSPPPHPLPFFPSLEEISVYSCGKMKRAVESEWMPHFPSLRRIIVGYCKKMEEIIRGPLSYVPVEEISLESLYVYNCDNMRKLFPHAWLLHLRNLRTIKVVGCERMVEMISGVGQGQEGSMLTHINNTPSSFQSQISLPKLAKLCLHSLPQLKSICEVPISCDFLKDLFVNKCPELKGIPLQLRLREIEELPYILVEDEEKWKMLMWDHPNAQAILQPYLRKGTLISPNAIVLDAGRKIAWDSALEESPAARPCFLANSTQVAI